MTVMGCCRSKHQHARQSEWLQQNRYRLFLKNQDHNLSRGEVALLRKVWLEVIQNSKTEFAGRVFMLIFSKCPDLRSLFRVDDCGFDEAMQNKRFYKHCLIFQDTLDMIIYALDCSEDDLATRLVTFGTQHAEFSKAPFEDDYWIAFGESLVEAMQLEHAANHKQWKRFTRVWKQFIRFVILSMQSGYLVGWRRKEAPSRQKTMIPLFPFSPFPQGGNNDQNNRTRNSRMSIFTKKRSRQSLLST